MRRAATCNYGIRRADGRTAENKPTSDRPRAVKTSAERRCLSDGNDPFHRKESESEL